jgi:ribosomal protein S8E
VIEQRAYPSTAWSCVTRSGTCRPGLAASSSISLLSPGLTRFAHFHRRGVTMERRRSDGTGNGDLLIRETAAGLRRMPQDDGERQHEVVRDGRQATGRELDVELRSRQRQREDREPQRPSISALQATIRQRASRRLLRYATARVVNTFASRHIKSAPSVGDQATDKETATLAEPARLPKAPFAVGTNPRITFRIAQAWTKE